MQFVFVFWGLIFFFFLSAWTVMSVCCFGVLVCVNVERWSFQRRELEDFIVLYLYWVGRFSFKKKKKKKRGRSAHFPSSGGRRGERGHVVHNSVTLTRERRRLQTPTLVQIHTVQLLICNCFLFSVVFFVHVQKSFLTQRLGNIVRCFLAKLCVTSSSSCRVVAFDSLPV